MPTIAARYFAWLCSFVCFDNSKRYFSGDYKRLLSDLFMAHFRVVNPMDSNRYSDGINMRYRFGEEVGIDDRVIAAELDTRDCSILEMMVSLAIRFDEQVVGDDKNRVGEWFWDAIDDLRLGSMSDSYYDEDYVRWVIDVFNDCGTLYDVKEMGLLSTHDIWWQINRHLIGKEGV